MRSYFLVLFLVAHVSSAQITVVPAQRFGEQMRRMFTVRQPLGAVQIIEE